MLTSRSNNIPDKQLIGFRYLIVHRLKDINDLGGIVSEELIENFSVNSHSLTPGDTGTEQYATIRNNGYIPSSNSVENHWAKPYPRLYVSENPFLVVPRIEHQLEQRC